VELGAAARDGAAVVQADVVLTGSLNHELLPVPGHAGSLGAGLELALHGRGVALDSAGLERFGLRTRHRPKGRCDCGRVVDQEAAADQERHAHGREHILPPGPAAGRLRTHDRKVAAHEGHLLRAGDRLVERRRRGHPSTSWRLALALDGVNWKVSATNKPQGSVGHGLYPPHRSRR
jgi:hypothetical protein